MGLINTVYAIGRLAASYPAARLRAGRGTRATVELGLAALIAGALACGVAPRFPVFLAGRLVMGAGASVAFLAILAELLEAGPVPWRGRLANAFEGMSIVSLAAGGVCSAVLAAALSWRAVFWAASLLLLLSVGVARWIRPDAGRRDFESGGRGSWRGAQLRALAPVYVASASLSLVWAGLFGTMVPLLGYDRYGIAGSALGWALAVGYLAEVAGLIGLGFVIDRMRREPAFLKGSLAVAAGGVVLALGSHPAIFPLGLALVGGGFAIWMIPPTVLADRAGTPLPLGHLAMYRIVMDGGMIVGPLLVSGVAELVGERGAVGAAGFILVGGALILARSGRGRGRQLHGAPWPGDTSS